MNHQPHSLSATAINEFLECGLAYKLRRVDKVEPEYNPATLLFGSAIHQALADYYHAKQNRHTLSEENLQERFASYWHKQTQNNSDIQYKAKEDYETLLQKGKDILAMFHQSIPEEPFKILGIEVPFKMEIEGLPVPVIGIYDLLLQDPSGQIIIVDHKTSGRAYSPVDIDQSLQLTVYSMAARRNGFAHSEILLRLDTLIKTKKPRLEQYYTVRTPDDERRMINTIFHVWNAIEKGVFIPHPSSWKCGYCSFKNHCDRYLTQ